MSIENIRDAKDNDHEERAKKEEARNLSPKYTKLRYEQRDIEDTPAHPVGEEKQ